MGSTPTRSGAAPAFQAPTGTRDFYPADLLRTRYIQDAWRRVSVRHGFEEVDGPTFEHLDLYTVKSGEGIVSELFSFTRAGGEKTYALRPEFTPTLARMYAARAASLPKPTRWYWAQTCFRAERPQRGRLREFLQWNCDILGDEPGVADADLVAVCVDLLREVGLTPADARVRYSDRSLAGRILSAVGVKEESHEEAFALLDRRGKVAETEFAAAAQRIGLSIGAFDSICKSLPRQVRDGRRTVEAGAGGAIDLGPMIDFQRRLGDLGVLEWCDLELSVVRGLAYYTGMVFEVHEATGAERAIAGGGRYDNLVELFGGPPTPAVGFGMGDVVLSLVLADKGLMPADKAIAERLGLRPDVFVVSNGTPEAEAAVAGVVAALRRQRLHARRTSKSTKNIGKLLKEAAACRARYALILETGSTGALKNLDTGEQTDGVAVGAVAAAIGPR